jgi:hypothetical protein
MRTPVALAFITVGAIGALAAAPAAAQDAPPTLTLEVGQSRALGGSAARCDDLTVVSVTLGPDATITALKVGQTTCSVAVGTAASARQVYTVKVIDPQAPPAGKDARQRDSG